MAALGLSHTNGWRWMALLGSFAAIYLTVGVIGFATLLEEA
jgi:hypothetical protein